MNYKTPNQGGTKRISAARIKPAYVMGQTRPLVTRLCNDRVKQGWTRESRSHIKSSAHHRTTAYNKPSSFHRSHFASLMADVLVLDTNVPFNATQWICAGKIYKDFPLEVSDTFNDARKIPPDLAVTLPSNRLPRQFKKDYEGLWIKPPRISKAQYDLSMTPYKSQS
ncbi:hypothetical protein B0H17DRAFT_1130159 [Mycena rosella]|uniref:Uncharacterized protein n=1 Tax=Mycena rosella TaxID=1033263 RepID=A0AAD7GJN7_MYCRO|nr:hypothetical protein B0H17DRAFT_1130159 [Mycena rosella]